MSLQIHSPQIRPQISLHIIASLLLVAVCAMHAQAQTPDSLGTIQSSPITCQGRSNGGTCYALDISCPSLPSYTAYIKILKPTVTATGTAVFVTGGGSTDLLELRPFGPVVVHQLLTSGYRIAEVTYGAPFNASELGWETDANGTGVRAAACRFATVLQWVHDNILDADTPLCAAGNSAGAELIGQSLAHYGAGNILAFAELSSGPPYGQLPYACENTQPVITSPCSGTRSGLGVVPGTAMKFIDPAYPGAWCSSSYATHSMLHNAQFVNDSILSPDAVLTYPDTFVNFVFGQLDTTSAIRQGLLYEAAISSTHAEVCVQGMDHEAEDSLVGAKQIATDMVGNCKLPPKK